MHLLTLLHELKALYGDPATNSGGTGYRWTIAGQVDALAIHLKLDIDEVMDRAIVWIFDPQVAPCEMILNGPSELDEMLGMIKRRVPARAFR